MTHRWRTLLIAGLLAVVGSTATQSARSEDTNRQNYTIAVHEDSEQSRADEKEVRDGLAMIRSGKIQEAIDGPLADVINRYEKAYGNSNDAVFSARGPAQGMRYMSVAAVKYVAGASGNSSGKAVDAGPAWAKAHWARGYGYSEMKRYPEAEAELNKALALSPEDAQFVAEQAYVYQMQHRFAESLALFEQVPKLLDTMDGWEEETKTSFRCLAFRSQGYNLVELHRLDEAQKAYESCLAVIPGEPKSLGELDYIKKLRGKSDSAN